MVIFSTIKRTSTLKMGKNCLHEDDVRKKSLQGCTCLKKMLLKKNFHTPPPPYRKMMVRPLYPQSLFKLQSQSNKTMPSRPGEKQRES